MEALVVIHDILVLHARLRILILFELFFLSHHAISLSRISILVISCNLALSSLISGACLLQTLYWGVLPLYHFSLTRHRMTKCHLPIHRLILLDRVLFVQIGSRLALMQLGLRICAIIVRFILTNLLMKLGRNCIL